MTAPLPRLPHQGPLSFQLDGERYTLPDIATPTWLDALGYATPRAWALLFPGHLPAPQYRRLERRLSDRTDPLDLDQLEKHALTLLGGICGTEFHAAQRLIALARRDWMVFDGWCASQNVDPYTTHISRLVNVVYWLHMSSCEKESERFRLQARLWAPPDGTRASGRSWDDDPDMTAKLDKIESDSFLALFP